MVLARLLSATSSSNWKPTAGDLRTAVADKQASHDVMMSMSQLNPFDAPFIHSGIILC
jgi:hypothetical protein